MLAPIYIPQIEESDRKAWPESQRLLKILDRLVCFTLLGCNHPKIVPCLRIVRSKFERPLKILARLLWLIFSQVEGAKIVIGVSVVWFRRDHFSKGLGRLLQVAVLNHRDAVGEVVALKCVLREQSPEGKRPLHSIAGRRWNRF